MGDCNVFVRPQEGRLCKYKYATWCPTCDRESPRRRSRSETQETCRKRGREMKSLTPKRYDIHQENLELESRDPRFDVFRIRANLCELPTTYISNNCQLSDVMDCLSSSDRCQSEWRDDMERRCAKSGSGKCARPSFEKSPLKGAMHVKNIEPHFREPLRKEAVVNRGCDTRQQNPIDLPSPNRSRSRYFGDFRYSGPEPQNSLSYDTCTFFDKNPNAADIQERYTREIEQLRSKLRTLKQKSQQHQSAPKCGRAKLFEDLGCLPKVEPCSEAQKCCEAAQKSKSFEAVLRPKCCEATQKPEKVETEDKETETILPVVRKESGKTNAKVTLKTKGRTAGLKTRKVRSKAALSLPSSTDCTESDCSVSSESEGEELPEDEAESISELTTDCSIKETTPVNETGLQWPLRPSLFPNVPPYISFNFHDAAAPYKLPKSSKALKWKLSTITPVLVRKTLTNTGFRLVRKSNEWVGTWGKHMKAPLFKTLKESQKLNHFPGTFQIGRKDRLWRNFQRLMAKFGPREFGFLPQTYVLPHDLRLLKQNWDFKNGGGNEMWIIKPPASARGVGIKVINKWSQLPKRMSLVVQKYIANPYLINGSKFDLRLYVLVTSFNPLKIYLYPDGLARFASAKYSDDAKDLKDRYMHLTNYSINKLSSQYATNEDANACQGHKWTISKLLEYMANDGVDTAALWRNLQQLVIKTIISGESSISPLCQENTNSLYNCYELFGVDVLLDERLKAWLLEVNISPSLHSASPLDAHVKGPLVKSLFDMVQFHLPPRLMKEDGNLQCLDSRVYATTLTKKERSKHTHFEMMETREDYLGDILQELTGDDVRQLLRYEDELTVTGKFERIFPTSHTHKYLQFMEARYYNRLFDAWETKYDKNRSAGINILQKLCTQKVHLKPAPPSTLDKNLSSMTLGEPFPLLPSREGQSHPPCRDAADGRAECCDEKMPPTVTNKQATERMEMEVRRLLMSKLRRGSAPA